MLSPISFQAASSKLKRATPYAAMGSTAPSEESASPSRDLVEITGGTAPSALKHALRNAGSFLARHGLSLVGLAVAGPVGMVLGSVASGTIAALEHGDKGVPEMLKSGLKSTGVSLAVGLGAGLPALFLPGLAAAVPGVLAGTGASAAFALDFKERLHKPGFQVDAQGLASRYHDAVKGELEKTQGLSTLLPAKPKFSWLSSDESKKAQISIAKTALVASQALGPAVAIALAGEIGRKDISPSRLGSLAQPSSIKNQVSSQNLDGVEVIRVNGFRNSERTDGFAHFDRIYLDADLPPTGNAKSDFVLGHEKSHVEHRDSSATLAQKAVLEAVENVYHLSGSSEEKSTLAGLHSDLEKARLAESREIEFRADQDGLAFALDRGHTQDQVYSAAQELFKNEPDTDPAYREHPQGKARLEAIKSTAVEGA